MFLERSDASHRVHVRTDPGTGRFQPDACRRNRENVRGRQVRCLLDTQLLLWAAGVQSCHGNREPPNDSQRPVRSDSPVAGNRRRHHPDHDRYDIGQVFRADSSRLIRSVVTGGRDFSLLKIANNVHYVNYKGIGVILRRSRQCGYISSCNKFSILPNIEYAFANKIQTLGWRM